MPPVHSSEILEYFFEMGPVSANGPLEMREVQSWAPVLIGYGEWPSWHARLFIKLSKDYSVAQHESTKNDAPSPWPDVERLWHWARNQKAEQSLDREEKRLARKAAKLEK